MGHTAYGKDLTPASLTEIEAALGYVTGRAPEAFKVVIDRLDKAGFMVISKPKEPAPAPSGE